MKFVYAKKGPREVGQSLPYHKPALSSLPNSPFLDGVLFSELESAAIHIFDKKPFIIHSDDAECAVPADGVPWCTG